MMMQNITFRPALPAEMPGVLGLLKEAALWLRGKKIDHWQNWIDPAPRFTAWIQQGFDDREFFMVESGSRIIGCFRLLWQDPQFWGIQQDNAGYIHSFTVRRDLAGRGLGYHVLGLIEQYCRERGKLWLRLDCNTNLPGLRHYYEKFGFYWVKDAICGGYPTSFYEKSIERNSGL
jgi:GNAT superfamily N-acetyltransferase